MGCHGNLTHAEVSEAGALQDSGCKLLKQVSRALGLLIYMDAYVSGLSACQSVPLPIFLPEATCEFA